MIPYICIKCGELFKVEKRIQNYDKIICKKCKNNTNYKIIITNVPTKIFKEFDLQFQKSLSELRKLKNFDDKEIKLTYDQFRNTKINKHILNKLEVEYKK